MRKIVSKEKAKRKEKIKNRIIGITLLFVMVLSVFGVVAMDFFGKTTGNPNKVVHNGTTFFNQQERWFFTKNNLDYSIVNSPENVTDIPTENLNPIEVYSGKPLYISSFDKSLESEVYYNFERIVYRMQHACLNETKCDGDFPIKTCDDSFILIEEGNETSIIQEQNCVFIKAPKEEIQNAIDAFFLKIIGIN